MVKIPDFDALYEADPDPFHVRSSFYEQRKLGLVLDCLTKPTYAAAWDPACGIGEMAARLAPRTKPSRVRRDKLISLRCDSGGIAISLMAFPYRQTIASPECPWQDGRGKPASVCTLFAAAEKG